MKYRIHAERVVAGHEVESTFMVEGDDILDIQEKANEGLRERGLNRDEVMVWSEEIK